MSNHRNQRGFTLIELIMVIVLMGIIAGMVTVFMKSPIDAYIASGRRAAMTDVADTVVRRIARDIHKALPNSIRSADTQCVEFIPTKTGGRYRAEGAGALDFSGTTEPPSFHMLGSNATFAGNSIPTDQQIASGDMIVVYNLGISGSDAYELSNTAVSGVPNDVPGTAETAIGITYSSGLTHFPLESGGNRFHVVPAAEHAVSFVCTDVTGSLNSAGDGSGKLYRYVHDFAAAHTCPSKLAGVAGAALLANNVRTCSFTYDPLTQRNAIVQMTLGLTRSNETVTLYHEVHVDNTP